MRKGSDNSVEHFQIRTVQRFPQPAEKSDLRRVQRPAVKMEPLGNSDTAMMALDSFDRIGAGQHHNVPTNCPGADVKLMRQISVSIMPPEAQNLQNFLAAFPRVHIHNSKILS